MLLLCCTKLLCSSPPPPLTCPVSQLMPDGWSPFHMYACILTILWLQERHVQHISFSFRCLSPRICVCVCVCTFMHLIAFVIIYLMRCEGCSPINIWGWKMCSFVFVCFFVLCHIYLFVCVSNREKHLHRLLCSTGFSQKLRRSQDTPPWSIPGTTPY